MTERQFLDAIFENADGIGPALEAIRGNGSVRMWKIVPLLEALEKFIAKNVRKCDRDDCPRRFLKSPRRKRFFCSSHCAHVVALRKFRKRNGINGHARKAAA
jgi:hypothetical protein